MFDIIIFLLSCFSSFVIGVALNKGLSSTNILEGTNKWSYDIPYVFTIGFNEMIIILYTTVFIATLFYIKYIKSESSRNQIKELLNSILRIEIIGYFFIVGTWWFTFNLRGLRKIDEDIYPIIVLGVIKYITILYHSNLENELFKNDLYCSRESLLKSIYFNLENSKRFSIIGDWGIGKTKLIENFFKGTYSYEKDGIKIYYRNRYRQLYLDVSSYSSNQKIVEILEKELNNAFKEAKLFKLDRNFSKEFFSISTSYLDLLKKIFVKEKTLADSKENIYKKIEEYQTLTNKRLVICLDNLERIDDKERITKLLSVIDEILSDNIIRIYLYDEQYMEKLFGEEEFKRYIEKYSELKIRINKLRTEEIIEKNEKVLELIAKYKINFEKELSSSSENVREIKHSIEISEMVKTMSPNKENEEKHKKESLEKYQELRLVEKKEKEIKKIYQDYQDKIYNPRYVLGMKKFIESNYLGYSLERLFEYKLIIDIFSEFDLNNEILRKIFFEKKNYECIKKEEELNELHNGRIKEKEDTVEGIIEKLKEKCKKGLGKDLFYYIDYCKKNDVPVDKIIEVLKEGRKYSISDLDILMELIKIDLEDGIDLNSLENFNVEIKKDFFGKNENYSEEKSREMIKIILILYYLKKLRSFIKYIYNKNGKYREIVKLFESDGRTFKEELKNILGISFDKFINGINEEFCAENRKEDNQLFKIINKQKLEKEFLILNKLNIIFEKENKAKLKTKLNQEYFNQMFEKNSGIHIKSFMNVETLEIRISENYYGAKEIIDKSNIEFYLEKIGEIKNNIEAEELLVEIYLLKERIKHLKIKKIRPNIGKIKKYYKNN